MIIFILLLGGIIIISNKFKDINEIYNIIQIKDDYIIIKEGNTYLKVYIYKIEPIILLDLSDDIKERIICEYKEFLRQINFDFQILIINKEVKFSDYIKQLNNDTIDSKIYNEYVKDMEIKFKNENIFDTIFYLIVKIRGNQLLEVENVNNSFKILRKIGCRVDKINDETSIREILNNSINKEW